MNFSLNFRLARWTCLAVCATLGLATTSSAQEKADAAWVALFDGKSLDGWEKIGKDNSTWEVKDGALAGSGEASMLVCTKGPYKNFKYRAEVKINDKGNSGLYFRTTRKPRLYRRLRSSDR